MPEMKLLDMAPGTMGQGLNSRSALTPHPSDGRLFRRRMALSLRPAAPSETGRRVWVGPFLPSGQSRGRLTGISEAPRRMLFPACETEIPGRSLDGPLGIPTHGLGGMRGAVHTLIPHDRIMGTR